MAHLFWDEINQPEKTGEYLISYREGKKEYIMPAYFQTRENWEDYKDEEPEYHPWKNLDTWDYIERKDVDAWTEIPELPSEKEYAAYYKLIEWLEGYNKDNDFDGYVEDLEEVPILYSTHEEEEVQITLNLVALTETVKIGDKVFTREYGSAREMYEDYKGATWNVLYSYAVEKGE